MDEINNKASLDEIRKSEGALTVSALREDLAQASPIQENEDNKTLPKPFVFQKKAPRLVQIQEYLFERYDFRYNTISNEVEYRTKEEGPFSALNENDLICELLEQGLKGVEHPFLCLMRSSRIPRFDPLASYFLGLPIWSPSQPDHIGELAGYVVAKDQIWFISQFRKMLVRTVAAALGRIAFNKQCFTLVGKQNDGKSSFLRFLCPSSLQDYLKENLDFNSKDGTLALCQNLFINLDELSALSRADINKIKATLSTDRVKERLPYDRKPTVFRRRASFLASTNMPNFLTDETGNVRWLVFEVLSIRHDNGGPDGYSKRVDIDLVYSQAMALLNSGFQFDLTDEERARSERNNQQFRSYSTEAELLGKYFSPGEEGSTGAVQMTTTEITEYLGEKSAIKLHANQVGRALRALNFLFERKYSERSKNTVLRYLVVKNDETG